MAFDKVIVFGPTGNIGSIAAQTAAKKGVHVYLAMRDPSKPIPGLTSSAEQAGKYQRVQADLSKPQTVRAAVRQFGVKAAFVYLAHGSLDHMLGTFSALRDGGVEHVVFLSSCLVPAEGLESVSSDDLIAFSHAQAELALRSIFSTEQVVAIRPGVFSTNVLQHKPGIDERKVKLLGPEIKFDWITNDDVGEVCGTVLVEGQRDGQDAIYLFGPEMLTQKAAYPIIGKALNEKIEVVDAGPEACMQEYVQAGIPEPMAKYLVKLLEETMANGGGMGITNEVHMEGVDNVRRYTGHPALKFEEWALNNKDIFV